MHVTALRIYPVKSMAGLDLDEVEVHRWGFEHDRRWMVVDAAGTTITARTHPRMLHVLPTPQADGGLVLEAPGRSPLAVARPGPEAEQVPLTLSRVGWGHAATHAADEWVSDHLGEPVRLVWLDDPGRRTVGEKHGGEPGDTLNFADAGPILLTTIASLERLDEWMGATAAERGEPAPDPLPMVRFRPSVVVEGAEDAFAEDDWKVIRIGEVEMRFAEHCDRCVLPTIDPVTLSGSKEPTRTLARHRQWDHKVHFGVRMIPTSPGLLRLGDPLSVG